MTKWQKFQEWMDSGEAGLTALVFMVAIFAFTGSSGFLPWASAIWGIGAFFLVDRIYKDQREMRRIKNLTNHL